MVERALERLQPPDDSVLFIENVGNLVCPAAFDLGEAHKVVVLSVTEGEDKPLKYPDMFRAATLMLLNKVDLLPYLTFDVAKCIEYARRVNPDIEVMQVSATKGDGMDAWLGWVRLHAITARHARVPAEGRPPPSEDADVGRASPPAIRTPPPARARAGAGRRLPAVRLSAGVRTRARPAAC